MFLVNAFSLNMVEETSLLQGVSAEFKPIPKENVPRYLVSAIGHADTAHVLSSVLGREVKPNRATISLKSGDVIYVAQYIGPRLPEGATTLPDGAKILFFQVTIVPTYF